MYFEKLNFSDFWVPQNLQFRAMKAKTLDFLTFKQGIGATFLKKLSCF